MKVELELEKVLSDEEIKECIKEGCVQYAKEKCATYLTTEEGYYHSFFTYSIIQYITDNYKEKLAYNVECALDHAKHCIEYHTWDKYNPYIGLILKTLEKEPERIIAPFTERIKTMNEDVFLEMLADSFASALYEIKKLNKKGE